MTQRAFDLDSRAVWVEQQLIHGILVPSDNLPIGPGEYDPKIQERHVPSPSIQRRSLVDEFVPSINRPSRRSVSREHIQSRNEFVTIYHEHDKRQPIDPHRRYHISQTDPLPQEPILDPILYDGKHKTVAPIFSSVDRNCCPVTLAAPSYDPRYDSPQVRPRQKLGVFLKETRPELFPPYADYSLPECPRTQSPPKERFEQFSTSTLTSPLALPRQKKKKQVFDRSSYDKYRKPAPESLTPSLVNKLSKSKVFASTLAFKQQYESSNVPSKISQRVRRNQF